MSLFKILLKSARQNPGQQELKHRVDSTPKTIAEYGIIAREILVEKSKTGLLEGVGDEVVAEMLADWERRIRKITNRKIREELERLGKIEEYEQACTQGIDQDAYYSYTITDYSRWIRRTLEEVKQRA